MSLVEALRSLTLGDVLLVGAVATGAVIWAAYLWAGLTGGDAAPSDDQDVGGWC